MTRWPAAFVVAVAALGAVTGCAPHPVDSDQIAQWRSDRQPEIDAESPFLAVFSSDSTAGQEGERTELAFDQPERPTAIRFDCFGGGTLELHLDAASTTGAATTTTTTIESIGCADGPHQIDPTTFGTDPITLVGIATANVDRDTAWFLTVRGE